MSEKTNPTVREIVRTYLVEHGYSGLRCGKTAYGEGCDLEDLLSCGSADTGECKAGYRIPDEEWIDVDPDAYLIVLEKPKAGEMSDRPTEPTGQEQCALPADLVQRLMVAARRCSSTGRANVL